MIIVTGIVAVELFVMMIGTAIPESRITAIPRLVDELRQNVRLYTQSHYNTKLVLPVMSTHTPLQNEINERVYVFMCTNMRAVIWIAISFAYKALLQLAAIFMAFTTRKVSVKGLNDTKEIYGIIYINTLILTVLIVTEFALKSHRDAYFTLYGLAIFAEATLFLSLTFIPKVGKRSESEVHFS